MDRRATVFQRRCLQRLNEVLQVHGKAVDFRYRTGDVPGYLGELDHDGRRFSLEVYPDTVVMYEGEHIYEAYLRPESQDDDSLIDAFARRLDRLLAGGTWEGDEREGWLDKLLDLLFGRRPGRVSRD